MQVKVGINGFGRIGRLFLRAVCDRGLMGKDIDIVAVVDQNTDASRMAYLLKYDSTHGFFNHQVKTAKRYSSRNHDDLIIVNGHTVSCLPAAYELSALPWKSLGIEFVLESTGTITGNLAPTGHIQAGAKKVVISGPSQGEAKTIVMGINEDEYDPEKHDIISAASCTAHCLAMPVYVLLKEGIGIESGMVTAINSYTGSQRLLDGISKRELRMSRSAPANIIPSTTSAAKLSWEIFPSLKGRLAGISYRVPTADVSLIDFSFRSIRDTSIEEIDALMKSASESYLREYMGYSVEELVSSDFIHNSHSSVYDSPATLSSNTRNEKMMFRLIAWYDNEWGYVNRLVDLICYITSRGKKK
jgi:glyceraldehyde 3-phosphate dehydrogenase